MQLSPDTLLTALTPYLAAKRFYIAYSGGMDSHVLLHLSAAIKPIKRQLRAVYVHHGLQMEADHWAEHCAETADQLAVEFIMLRVCAVAKSGESPEAAAREARYQALRTLIEEQDVLLLAHHQEDQLETVLLQLFRGAGIMGLSGMPAVSPFAQGVMLRPLLDVSRQMIESYADQQGLNWIEDSSNQDCKFRRNFLRHQVIPLLKQHWPAVAKTVSRSAGHCAETQTYINTIASDLFKRVFNPTDRTLSISQLLIHNRYQQQLIVRKWFQVYGERMPAERFIETIFSDVIRAGQGRDPVLQGQGVCVRRYRDKLFIIKAKPVLENQCIAWSSQQMTLQLKNNGQLQIIKASLGIAMEHWHAADITVSYRKGGENLPLPGRKGHHTLKKLLQESAVPPWQRASIPLIFIDGQLAAVADKWISSDFYCRKNQGCYVLKWQTDQ